MVAAAIGPLGEQGRGHRRAAEARRELEPEAGEHGQRPVSVVEHEVGRARAGPQRREQLGELRRLAGEGPLEHQDRRRLVVGGLTDRNRDGLDRRAAGVLAAAQPRAEAVAEIEHQREGLRRPGDDPRDGQARALALGGGYDRRGRPRREGLRGGLRGLGDAGG